MTYILVGPRIGLRELVESDWSAIHDYASKPIVTKYQPWGPNTKEDTKAYVQEVLKDATHDPRTRFVFAIIQLEEERLIGSVEINIRDHFNLEGEIGYIIHPEYWGQGYATEAASLILDFGFANLRLHRVFATCDPNNIASSKVLEKIGMYKEGILREHMRLRSGGWRDSSLYSILEREWILRIHNALQLD